MKPRIILAHICYKLAHWISYPIFNCASLSWLYPAYSKLIGWSSDLDNEDAIWTTMPSPYEQQTNNTEE
jgi:hypothetical protein